MRGSSLGSNVHHEDFPFRMKTKRNHRRGEKKKESCKATTGGEKGNAEQTGTMRLIDESRGKGLKRLLWYALKKKTNDICSCGYVVDKFT